MVVAATDFDLVADRQGGQRVGVADVEVGEDGHAVEYRLPFDDLLQGASVDAAGSLEPADEEGGQLGGVRQLE